MGAVARLNNTMNTTILNRDFQHPADGWYHIEPKGEHPNRTAGVVQVIDDQAVHNIVNRFNLEAMAGKLSHGHEMLIDHEHFSHDADKETRAFGWLTQLENRNDGVYGRIRWSNTGKQAVDGGDYRFFSTEYSPDDLEEIDKDRVRPKAIAGLTLTNRPNNRGGKPITNRNNLPPSPAASTAEDPADKKIKNRETMKQIANKLGLSADASEDAILGELSKITNRATDAEGKLNTLVTERDLYKNRVETLLGEQIDAELDAHGITDEAARGKLKPVLLPMKNREERIGFLGLIGKEPKEKQAKIPLTNRDKSKTPNRMEPDGDEDEEENKKKADKIKNRAEELKGAAPSRSFANCWAQASREIAAGK